MGSLPERTSVDVNSASAVEIDEHDLIHRVQAGEMPPREKKACNKHHATFQANMHRV